MIQKSDIPENAIKYSQNESKISFSENGRIYAADNSTKKCVLGFKVDGGLITSQKTKKCDYSLVVNNDLCYLIELKGQDVGTACKQLLITMEYFLLNYEIQKFVGRIVISHYNTHKLNDENYRSLQRKLRFITKQFGITQNSLIIKENKLKEKI